jgi:hypothetical protein
LLLRELGDERALALSAVDDFFGLEGVHRLAYGPLTHPELKRERLFARQQFAWPPLALDDPSDERFLDLRVEGSVGLAIGFHGSSILARSMAGCNRKSSMTQMG